MDGRHTPLSLTMDTNGKKVYHNKHFVKPGDPSDHTNTIEGIITLELLSSTNLQMIYHHIYKRKVFVPVFLNVHLSMIVSGQYMPLQFAHSLYAKMCVKKHVSVCDSHNFEPYYLLLVVSVW